MICRRVAEARPAESSVQMGWPTIPARLKVSTHYGGTVQYIVVQYIQTVQEIKYSTVHCVLQYSTKSAEYSTVQLCTVHLSVVSTVVQYSAVQYSSLQYCAVSTVGTVLYCAVRFR